MIPAGYADGLVRREPSVNFYKDLHLRTDRFANGADPLDRQVLLRATDMRSPRVAEWVELERGEAASDDVAGALRELL